MTVTDLRDPGFRAAVAAEWTKFSSLRSVRVALVLGVVLGVGATALFGWAVLATWQEWPAEERAEFRPAESALSPTSRPTATTFFLFFSSSPPRL